MFLEVVRSAGLAHLSYILGDAGRAAVIDPRRDYACHPLMVFSGRLPREGA